MVGFSKHLALKFGTQGVLAMWNIFLVCVSICVCVSVCVCVRESGGNVNEEVGGNV